MPVEKDNKIIDMLSVYVQKFGMELIFAERVNDSDNPDMWVVKARKKNGQEVSYRIPLDQLPISIELAKQVPSIIQGIFDFKEMLDKGKKRKKHN